MKRPSTITGILLECVDMDAILSEANTITVAGTHYMAGQRLSLNGKVFTILGIQTTVDHFLGIFESKLTLLPADDPE